MSLNPVLLNSDFWPSCQTEISKVVPSQWLEHLELVNTKNDLLTLGVPNSFILKHLQKHYWSKITQKVQSVYPNLTVKLINLDKACTDISIEDTLPSSPKSTPKVSSSHKTYQIDSLSPLNPLYTMDLFTVGSCNSLVQAACQTICNHLGKHHFNPFIISGTTGLGKTHLLHAICSQIKLNKTAHKVVYRTSEEFLTEYIQFIQTLKNKPSASSFHKKFKSSDIFIIDDLQFLAKKNSTQEELFKILTFLQQAGKQIIIASDYKPHHIKGIDQRLLSLFEKGLTLSLNPMETDTRLSMLHQKSKLFPHNFLNKSVYNYLSNLNTQNARELEGILFKLFAYANYKDVIINNETAKQILGDTIHPAQKVITIQAIIQIIANHYDISESHITSIARHKEITLPRQIAMYFAHTFTDNSLNDIGLSFNRNYGTVAHSIKKIETKRKIDSLFQKKITQLKQKIKKHC